MTARTLDGKATLATIKEELKDRIAALAERGICLLYTSPSPRD